MRNEQINYGQAIRDFRKANSLTQIAVGRKLKIRSSYVSDLENSRRTVTKKMLRRIGIAFNLNRDWYKNAGNSISLKQNSNWKYCPHCGEPLK